MATTCGHLYCAECATRHFLPGDPCAICRRGPYDFDELVRLYPDYVRTRSSTPKPSAGSSSTPSLPGGYPHEQGKRPAPRRTGMSAIDACFDVLEDRSVLESPALGTALDRCAHSLDVALC